MLVAERLILAPLRNHTFFGLPELNREVRLRLDALHSRLHSRSTSSRSGGPAPPEFLVHFSGMRTFSTARSGTRRGDQAPSAWPSSFMEEHDPRDYLDPGYASLGEFLASRSFILVSVDMNFLNGSIREENNARGWMLLKHRGAWKRFDADLENPFYEMLDWDRIPLMGHSRGRVYRRKLAKTAGPGPRRGWTDRTPLAPPRRALEVGPGSPVEKFPHPSSETNRSPP